MEKAEKIYLACLEEIKVRIRFVEEMNGFFNKTQYIHYLESAVLQIRKSLELLAFSSLSPNRVKYEKFRLSAKKPEDYRKDYNGNKIIKALEKINRDFYPLPLVDPHRKPEGHWHFDRYEGEFLTKQKYEKFYDKCGALLHADNPWGSDKGYKEFAPKIPQFIKDIRSLLRWHFIVVEHDTGRALWVAKLGSETEKARVIKASATGEFIVTK